MICVGVRVRYISGRTLHKLHFTLHASHSRGRVRARGHGLLGFGLGTHELRSWRLLVLLWSLGLICVGVRVRYISGRTLHKLHFTLHASHFTPLTSPFTLHDYLVVLGLVGVGLGLVGVELGLVGVAFGLAGDGLGLGLELGLAGLELHQANPYP